MENFLQKIEKMFEKQNVFIQKNFNKLSKRITSLKSRVATLEKDKRSRESKPKITVKNFESFSIPEELCQTDLKVALSGIDYLKTSNIESVIVKKEDVKRKIPTTFLKFVKKQFENPELCNIYQKGDRTYVYKDGWSQLDAPVKELRNCLTNLWNAYCDILTEMLQDKDGYARVYSKIIVTNTELGCPMTTPNFKTILRKVSKK
jgi:hypothetical protein